MFLKDSIFQGSSPSRYTAELGRLLKVMFLSEIATILFKDGGPDHNNKHTSVQLGLLALFIGLDLDTMVVMRTTRQNVEQVLLKGLCSFSILVYKKSLLLDKRWKRCTKMASRSAMV